MNNPFFVDLASTINSEVRKFGYIKMMSDSDENQEIEEMELQQVISRNVEGLIITPCDRNWEHIKQLHDQGLPIICIDRYFEELDITYAGF